jgi:hypothetical protein
MAADTQLSVRAPATESEHQSQLAFYWSGKRPSTELEAPQGPELRPALLARYRDLTALRYDFPLVLMRDGRDKAYVQCLSGVVDGVIHEIAKDDDGERLTKHLLRLEREIRVLAAAGAAGPLSQLWDTAAGRLAANADDLLKDSLKRARAALKCDGEVADCDRELPVRLLTHAWRVVQDARALEAGEEIARLKRRLADILEADRVRSTAGRSAASLKASVGAVHAQIFDFEAMSRVLAKGASGPSLADSRRRRIDMLLSVLGSQRLLPIPGESESRGRNERAYSFAFDSCASALTAYRQRLPLAVELAKAIAIAKLEIAGEYKEGKHDALFGGGAEGALAQEEMSRFPDYLICVSARKLKGAEGDKLMEMLSAGLPVKILVQTDELTDEPSISGDAHLGFGTRAKQLATMAIGLSEVYVLQSSASNLFQYREHLFKGMAYRGPALFSIYSGASSNPAALPAYLDSAAAMEARAFPAYTYNPSAGPNLAARFSLDGNIQAELDWPVQAFDYEDERNQRVVDRLAFTPIDFLCCDPRYAKHFARVPRAKWNASMVPVADYLAREATVLPEKVPCVLMVDRDDMLQKAIADDALLRAVQRCREHWHSLQELGGIHNSHAEQLLARERKVWEEHEQRDAASRTPQPRPETHPAEAGAATTTVPVAAVAVSAEAEENRSSDEAYIETPRCTTCNECTQINSKMFAYDENKQARIVDVAAGTYRQLVEAAESCQVAIIHPGKPRDPNESGLDELIKRAEPFR